MYAEYTAVRHTVNYANSLRCGQGAYVCIGYFISKALDNLKRKILIFILVWWL